MSVFTDMMGGAAMGVATGAVNVGLGSLASKYNAGLNYHYNEKAAENADRRTRALYEDYMSPASRIKQLKDAGLSPSLFADGAGAGSQGVTAGAQGAGAGGVGLPTGIISPVDVAGIRLANAQAEKAKAEAVNINEDTTLKQLQQTWQEMQNNEKSVEFNLSTAYLTGNNGSITSMYELAENSYNFDKFLESVRESAKISENGEEIIKEIGTEYGQKTMRQIFMCANRFDRDIKILSAEGVDADFQKSVLNALKNNNFAEKNAQEVVTQLEASIESANLTKEQKESWNNLIDRLRKTNSTAADVVIVLSMIADRIASSWNVGGRGTQHKVVDVVHSRK